MAININVTVFLILVFAKDISAVTDADVTFQAYTNPLQTNPVIITQTNVSQTVNLNVSIVLIIHGWMSSSNSDWVRPLKDALYSNFSTTSTETSVIVVDWSRLAASLDIFSAVSNAIGVGQIIGNLLETLATSGASLENVHLCGHSAGAQIAAFAAQQVLKVTGNKIGRITGLDPAGGTYDNSPPDQRLDATDATVVVAVHTDRGVFGTTISVGTVDFYPNGGNPGQPGCPFIVAPSFTPDGYQNILAGFFACSHLRAPAFFTDALINPNTLVGSQCDSNQDYIRGLCKSFRIDLGGYVSPSTNGNFYLKTKAIAPYGL